ncbi:MAG: hypothetical protein AB1714_14230 [Acidobacteriota bacterium]
MSQTSNGGEPMAARNPSIAQSIVLWSCLVLLAPGTGADAQTLDGTWVDSQYGITLVLAADGSYGLQHANGRSQGRCGVSGNVLWLQDAAGGAPVQYAVLQLTTTELVLQDGNGVQMRFLRQSTASPPSGAPPTSPAAAVNTDNTVLARAGAYALSRGQVSAGIGLLQFIIGQPVTPAEAKELEDRCILEFNQQPERHTQELESLNRSLQQLYTLTDPLRIGLARQQLFAALYLASRELPESEKPLMIQVMNRHIRVLAYDAATQSVLTDRDVTGMVRYLAFLSGLSGQPVQLTDSLRQSVESDLMGRFPQMTVEQKQLVCSASLLWQLMEGNWSRLTPSQQQQFRAQYAAQVGPPAQPQQYSAPSRAGASKGTMYDQMREAQARQNMFRIMNNINRQTHATSLNIIENIGGTGNYWKVVDLPDY